MLEFTNPGFLKRDVYRRAQEDNRPLDFPASLTDAARRCPIVRLTKKPEANLRIEKRPTRKVAQRGTVGLKFQLIRKPGGRKSRANST